MDNARLFEAAQHEIQQRRHMEDHQTLLLKELSHRVKNSLAVVQAIANQTLKNVASPQAFVSTFSGRLMALGRAHDLLSKNDWRGASLQELLLAGLAPFTQRDSGRIELVGEDILLHSDAAPALAMVIHELATNAAKYGALSTSTGSVSAIWNKTIVPGTLTIQWTERNGPPVKTPSRRGFGLIFIERVVGHQLDGRATLEFAADGLRCEIEIPLGGERNVQPELTSSRA
jgi:two-component sensor histidine kinase